jgi:hypothetical protein
MLIAGLGSTRAVLGRETDCRKASVGMCIVRWRVATAVVMVAGRRQSERIGGPEPLRSATECGISAMPAPDETVRSSASRSLISHAVFASRTPPQLCGGRQAVRDPARLR